MKCNLCHVCSDVKYILNVSAVMSKRGICAVCQNWQWRQTKNKLRHKLDGNETAHSPSPAHTKLMVDVSAWSPRVYLSSSLLRIMSVVCKNLVRLATLSPADLTEVFKQSLLDQSPAGLGWLRPLSFLSVIKLLWFTLTVFFLFFF